MSKNFWFVVAAMAAVLVSGCAAQIPAIGTTVAGREMRGEIRAGTTLNDGTLTLSDGKVTCTAPMKDWGKNPTIFITATCSDGRTARGQISRPAALDFTVVAGNGELTFPDGERVLIAFGPLI